MCKGIQRLENLHASIDVYFENIAYIMPAK